MPRHPSVQTVQTEAVQKPTITRKHSELMAVSINVKSAIRFRNRDILNQSIDHLLSLVEGDDWLFSYDEIKAFLTAFGELNPYYLDEAIDNRKLIETL